MTPAPKTVTLTIDGVQLSVPEGTLLVEAAKQIRKEIPVYCYHTKLGPAGLCRICLVEIEKMPKLQIACNTVATDGMVVHTASEKTNEGRRAVLEFLLLNHPLDCPICDKGGECDLQDFSMAYGQGASRKLEGKVAKPKAVDLGPTIVLDEERCIVCQRCVRFDDIITQERSLVVKDRGHRDIIATSTEEPYRSDFSGNVTELCPVGALTSKTYRFKSRPWDLRRTKTTCTQCSVGCQLYVDERYGEVLRTMSVADDEISDGWLCDRGRYNVGFYGDERRVTSPLLRRGDGWEQIGWDDAVELWAAKLKDALGQSGPRAVAALGGGRLVNEEAFLLQHVFRTLGVENLDWRTGRQSVATTVFAGSYEDLENAQTILVLGVPPSQSAPIMDLRIRKAVVNRGARLIVVGPHGAGSHVAETRVARVQDVPQAAFDVKRLAVVFDGVDVTSMHDLEPFLARPRAAGAAIAGFIAGEQPNARGAEAMGMLPKEGGLATREVLAAAADGAVRALGLFGVNPMLHYPDAALVRAALERVEFVTVSDLFMTETARMASLVLPARGPFEKDGHTLDMTGAVHRLSAAHAPPVGTLSDGDMLIALAAELGIDVPSAHELTEAACAPKIAESRATTSETAAHERDGRLRVAIGSDIFAGGGTVFHDDRLLELRPRGEATLSPSTAGALHLESGDRIDVMAGDRSLRGLLVRVSATVADDTVGLVGGVPEAPANLLRDGEEVEIAKAAAGRAAAAAGAA